MTRFRFLLWNLSLDYQQILDYILHSSKSPSDYRRFVTVGFSENLGFTVGFFWIFSEIQFPFSPEAKIFDFSHLKLWNCNIRFALWQKRNGAWILKFSRSYRTEKSKFWIKYVFSSNSDLPLVFPKSQIYRRFLWKTNGKMSVFLTMVKMVILRS